jgi:hypothetical protein
LRVTAEQQKNQEHTLTTLQETPSFVASRNDCRSACAYQTNRPSSSAQLLLLFSAEELACWAADHKRQAA